MKISKASWLILIAGVVFVTFASLGIAGAKQMSEQGELNDELSIAERRVDTLQLEQLTLEQEEFQKKLEQVHAESEAVKDKLRFSNESIDVTDFLFEIAQLTNVTILNVSSPGLSSTDLEAIPCTAQSLSVIAEGEVSDLIAFVTRLNNDFTTGLVQSADISIPEESEEEEDGESLPAVQVRLIVYSYEGE